MTDAISAAYSARRADLERQRKETQSRVVQRELDNALAITDVCFVTYLAFLETVVAAQKSSSARLRRRNRLLRQQTKALNTLRRQPSDFAVRLGPALAANALQLDRVIGKLDQWTHVTVQRSVQVAGESVLRVLYVPTVNLGSAALDVLWDDVIKGTSKRVADAATLWVLAVLKRAKKRLPSSKASDDYHVQLTNYMKAVESVMYAIEEMRQGMLGGLTRPKATEARVASALKERFAVVVAR